MRLTLEFTTSDQSLIALCEDYWARTNDGKWMYRMQFLEQKHGIASGRVPLTVAKACHATMPEIQCSRCHGLIPMNSHAAYSAALRETGWAKYGRARYSVLCTGCQRGIKQQERAAALAAREARDALVLSWLQDGEQKSSAVNYDSMSLLHAFLLDGLLLHAGDAWRGEHLDAWMLYRPQLCSMTDDIRTVYRELYEGGWLRPSTANPLTAFKVAENGHIEFDVLQVSWVIAQDVNTGSAESIREHTNFVLRHVLTSRLRGVWQWVSLCELRASYARYHKDRLTQGAKWSDAMDRVVIDLLERCSVGRLKQLLWYSCHKVTNELSKRGRSLQGTYNKLPGFLSEAFDYFTKHGSRGEPYAPERPRAILTSHLFDHIMGSSEDMFTTLTGETLIKLDHERLSRAVQDVNASAALEGYALTPQMAAMQQAFIAGRLTIDEFVNFMLLSAKATSIRNMLHHMDVDDPERLGHETLLEEITVTLRQLACRCGYDISEITLY